MIEMWLPIKKHEGLYEISNYGIVRSVNKTFNNRFHPSKIISQTINTGGYYRINLNHPELKKSQPVIHRMVAEHFILNPSRFPVVNHIDGNKLNNRADNLEWCTQKHNSRHAFSTGLQKSGPEHHGNRLVLDTATGVFYNSIREYSSLYNAREHSIYQKLSGLRRNKTTLIFA